MKFYRFNSLPNNDIQINMDHIVCMIPIGEDAGTQILLSTGKEIDVTDDYSTILEVMASVDVEFIND